MSEHLFIQDLREHPRDEVRLYANKKLISGTYPEAITNEIDNLRNALVAIQKEHRPIYEGDEPVGCRTCDWDFVDSGWPCNTRRMTDNILGSELNQPTDTQVEVRKRLGIGERAENEAKAKEHAELEAEAFKLYRAYMDAHEPPRAIGSWSMLSEHTQKVWIVIARHSREMGAKK